MPHRQRAKSSNAANEQWPESYGFSIFGGGPCYVVHVQSGSVAQSAGLCPGDQLLEVAGHSVVEMSAEAVSTLAAHSRSVPPTVGVVSRVQHAELVASRRWGYGMTLKGVRPTVVEAVDPPGPAYQAGVRKGDVVLEINGRKVNDLSQFLPLLVSKYGRLTVAVIPVEQKPPGVDTMEDRGVGQASRVRKARDLFAKMNVVLGGDFEKKMAVTGLLKQYAEDRDIETFADALSIILTTVQQRHLIRELRPFIPVNHRASFDACLGHDPGEPWYDAEGSVDEVTGLFTASAATAGGGGGFLGGAPQHVVAQQNSPRTVVIDRARGSFGFVLRGHDPVSIETVVPGGPADKAGLRAGDTILGLNGVDVRRCSHSHLIKLLQGSGNSPRLEVNMLDALSNPAHSPTRPPTQPPESPPASSASSHVSSTEWPPEGERVTEVEGQTFKDRVEFLLTAREKTHFRKALMEYNMERNIAQFTDEVSFILDTPSKRSLWPYLLSRMTNEHRQYVLRYVPLSKQQVQAVTETAVPKSSYHTLPKSDPTPDVLGSTLPWEPGGIDIDDEQNSSFKQQLDYLLTSRERLLLKKALQIYAQRRNVQNLLEDLGDILDTPSKRSLWFYIVPLLSPPHQRYCQQKLSLPEHVIKHRSPNREHEGEPRNGLISHRGISATPRRGDVTYHHDDMTHRSRNTSVHHNDNLETSEEDSEYTAPTYRVPVHHGGRSSRRRHLSAESADTNSSVEMMDMLPLRPNAPGGVRLEGEQSTITVAPIYAKVSKVTKAAATTTRPQVKMVRESSVQTTPLRSPPLYRPTTLPNDTSSPSSWDYRTFVKVYEAQGGVTEIMQVQNKRNRKVDKTGAYSATNGHRHLEESRQGQVPVTVIDSAGATAYTTGPQRFQNRRDSEVPVTIIDYPNDTVFASKSHPQGQNNMPGTVPVTVIDTDTTYPMTYHEVPSAVFDRSNGTVYTTSSHQPRMQEVRQRKMPVTSVDTTDNNAYPVNGHHKMQDNMQEPVTVFDSATGTLYTTNRYTQVQNSRHNSVPMTVIDPTTHTHTRYTTNNNARTQGSRHKKVSMKTSSTANTTNRPTQSQGQSPLKATSRQSGGQEVRRHQKQQQQHQHQQEQQQQQKSQPQLIRRETEQPRETTHFSPEPTYATIPSPRSGSEDTDAVIRHEVEMGDDSDDDPELSYQAQAMDAIQALDDIVDNEVDWVTPSNHQQVAAPHVPPPPPPPPPPPVLAHPLSPKDRSRMNVKRMNWEKIDVVDENTVWAKIDQGQELEDMVKYLELEQQFSTKKTKLSDTFSERKTEVHIISAKKAYNISILLGHQKMLVAEIKQALLQLDEHILTPELLRQLLAYTPDSAEMEKYDTYRGGMDDLSKPDQFVYQISRVPGFEERLKAMLFKANLAEKVEEVKANLKCIRKASLELERSSRLAKVLELVLAMGNYMNKGHSRVGEAAGFRISFLPLLDMTKTSDGKGSFLHVLADAIYAQSPSSVSLSEELQTVPEAAKVSDEAISQELVELRKVLQEISTTVNKLSIQKQRAGVNDRFHEVMEHFISQASDEIQSLFSLQASAHQDFQRMVQYFGEDPKTASSNEIFGTFAEFISKFEKAHHHNMQFKRHHSREAGRNSPHSTHVSTPSPHSTHVSPHSTHAGHHGSSHVAHRASHVPTRGGHTKTLPGHTSSRP